MLLLLALGLALAERKPTPFSQLGQGRKNKGTGEETNTELRPRSLITRDMVRLGGGGNMKPKKVR